MLTFQRIDNCVAIPCAHEFKAHARELSTKILWREPCFFHRAFCAFYKHGECRIIPLTLTCLCFHETLLYYAYLGGWS